MVKILSWNIAGIRPSLKRGELDFLQNNEYDIICFQETKADENQVILTNDIPEIFPYRYWESNKGITQKKGFSGTCIWSKQEALKLPSPDFDLEGRITCIEYSTFILVNVYTPNSQSPDSERFIFRSKSWDNNFRKYINELNSKKNTIICGDFNVAHKDIDVYDSHKKKKRAGFLDEERDGFQKHLDSGYVDAFRLLCKDNNCYTYWDQRFPNLRKNNRGWRIDYFMIPELIKNNVSECTIHKDILGSDHCPLSLNINI